MPNITISIDEQLLKSGRNYAEEHQNSRNALIRNLPEQTV
jgi:metal-responsive CopG/Arc/MetJ family transcriptional regulator